MSNNPGLQSRGWPCPPGGDRTACDAVHASPCAWGSGQCVPLVTRTSAPGPGSAEPSALHGNSRQHPLCSERRSPQVTAAVTSLRMTFERQHPSRDLDTRSRHLRREVLSKGPLPPPRGLGFHVWGEGFLAAGTVSLTNGTRLCVRLPFLFG